jgi:uncharacterized membrane protein
MLHHILVHLSIILTICADVVVLFFVYPAYKKTRNLGLALLFFAYLIGVYDMISDYTFGRSHMPTPGSFQAWFLLRELGRYTSTILGAAGLIILVNSFVRSFSAPAKIEEPVA